MKRLFPTLVVIGFSAAAVAQALPEFEDVDADSNGQISREEASVVEGLDFARLDTNQDGVIDRVEYSEAGR